MIKILKKPLILVPLILVVVLIVGLIVFRKKQLPYEFVTVKKSDLVQEVSVTGRVKPAEDVNLAFEQGGKIKRVYAKVGDKVNTNQSLADLDMSELSAKLAQTQADLSGQYAQSRQYEAAKEAQQANLNELENGTRPEELQVAKTKVQNAKVALADTQKNLKNVIDKATVDLSNAYDSAINILNSSYIYADGALHKYTDTFFNNPDSSSPQLSFTTDLQAKTDTEFYRLLTGQEVTAFQAETNNLRSGDYINIDKRLISAKQHLMVVKNFLSKSVEAVNGGILTSATKSSYKSDINTAQTNVNTALTNIDGQQQTIAAQRITNQKNIDSAQSSVNDNQSALTLAENELTLKEAGAATEQIASQRAQLKQAQANLEMQQAKIQQAQASVWATQAQLAKMTIRAPMNGIITVQDGKVGQIVAANQSIISLISEAELEIEADIPEADLPKITIGEEADVTLDAYGRDDHFKAKVTKIDPAGSMVEGVAIYKTTLQFENKDERLKAEMTANVTIIVAKRENVAAVPQRAIFNKGNGHTNNFIRLVSGTAIKEVPVKVGLIGSDGNAEIVEGVREGDKIVTYLKQ